MKYVYFSFLVVFLFKCQSPKEESPIMALEKEIMDIIEPVEGDFGVAFRLLGEADAELFINEKEEFHAASTMKTPVMIEVFKQAKSGEFSLEDSMLIVNEFKSIIDGSTFAMDLNVDSQEGLYERIGQKATVDELMYQMIIKSSNLATNILIQRVDAEKVTQSMRDLGANDIQVLRGVEDLKAFEAGRSNTTTALDMMLIMEAIATGNAVDQAADQQMMAILYDQYYKDLIPKLLPNTVKIAHKTGSITGVQHDAAIVELPDGIRYVLVILTKNLTDVEVGKQAIAEISMLIYDFVTSRKE